MKGTVFCVIMGGGRGTRLYPLTQSRCKPAVPLAGKYRLVDIPISNCLNSGFNRIYLLTQFNTASLHRHIQEAYKFDPFGGGFVDILSAEQTESGEAWYQGTADAVRQNMHHFGVKDGDYFIILSGDQLYRMDLHKMVEQHKLTGADVTIAATIVPREQAHHYGVMRVAEDRTILGFAEKPETKEEVDSFVLTPGLAQKYKSAAEHESCLASMGIYVFNAAVMRDALSGDSADFGKEIIPGLLGKVSLNSYIFDGYWEDIGTVRAFFEANLMLTDTDPAYDFYHGEDRVYTRAHFLPPARFLGADMDHSMVADGCTITKAKTKRCVISSRSIIREGSDLENVYMMGADHFEEPSAERIAKAQGLPPIGIGKNCKIKDAIIDKNARIGDNVTLSPEGKPDHFHEGCVYVRDGILIVTKNGVVPTGTSL